MKKLLAFVLIAGSVSAEQAILNTFTTGELSPHLDARIDFDKYKSGCRTLENFVVLPYGGAQKRPGTQYIADTKNNGVARLAPFSVGVDQTYVMELGQEYIRFYTDGVQILNTNDVPLEVSTPYSTNDLFEIQLSQFADTVYMVHPDYPVQKLQRTTTAPTFTLQELEFTWPPVVEENLTDTTITPSAITGAVTLVASDSLWTTNHVGADWVLRSPNASDVVELNAAGTSDVINVEGNWNLIIKNIYDGETLTLQVSEDDGNTWGDFREYGGLDKTDYDRSGTESEQGIKYRMVIDGGDDDYAKLKCEEPYINGFVTITNYISSTQVQAVVQSELGSTDATEIWYEGAYSEERGYPKTVEFFQNRLWFGGTPYQVNTLWASATDDYENFKIGTYDDSALQLAINSDNIIEWLLARNQLFIGTLGDEWILDGGDSSTPVSPTSVLARRQTGFGSKDGIDALIASDILIYLQRQGRKLREFEYNLESDSYQSIDATLLAEHITESGVIQISEQQQPDPIIWCVCNDGQIAGLTFNKLQDVYGWHRQKTDGEFESIATIPTEGEDQVYVVVNRENGRYIERFRPVDWGDDDDAWFVDSGLAYDGGDSAEITDISSGTNLINVSSSYGPVNGVYTYLTQTNGYGMWTNGANQIFNVNGWKIFDGDIVYYESDESVTFPSSITNWNVGAYSSSVDAVPSALSGSLTWHDTLTQMNGETVYYDASNTYAYWNDGTNWFISAAADVGGSPTNYFREYPSFVTVSGLSGIDAVNNGEYDFNVFNEGKPMYGNWDVMWNGSTWDLQLTPYLDSIPSTSYLPPKTGWPVGDGGTSPMIDYGPTTNYQGQGSWSGSITITEQPEPEEIDLSRGSFVATSENSFTNGDSILLSGQGGTEFVSFGDGIFIATNCTPTTFELLYKTGEDIYCTGSYTGGVTATEVQNTFTNVSHLAGQTVDIFADGGAQPQQTVSGNGVLTTADYHNRVIAGLSYKSRLSPMYIETVSQSGTSYGKVKNPYKVHFRVNESGAFEYGSSMNDLHHISVRDKNLPAGQPVPFFSGDPTTLPIGIDPCTDPEFWVVSDDPLPLELLSLTIFTSVTEYE